MHSDAEPHPAPTAVRTSSPPSWAAHLSAALDGRFDAVLFDCDGTLVDSEPLCERAWNTVARDYRLPTTAAAPGASFGQRIAVLRDSHPETPATEMLHLAYWSRLRSLYRAELRPIPLVYETALALRAARTPLAIVSNSDQERLEFTIRCAAPLLQGVPLIGLHAGSRPKPDPDLYLLAARHLEVRPARCLVVEDSAVGAAAGRSAGMTVAMPPS